MFRGGGASWQGTGITTGLDTPPRIDLAQGGRTIGGGLIHGTPMGNRTGFDTPYVEGYNRIQWNKPTRVPLNITKIAEVGTPAGTTGTTGTGSSWRSNLKPPRHWWKEEQWLKRGIPATLKAIGTNIKRFATGRGILGFPVRFALGNPYVLSVAAIVGSGAYGFKKYMEYVDSLPPEEQAELGIKHEQWGINYLESKGYDVSAIEEFGGTKDWKAVLQDIANKEEEFLGRVERQETIAPTPPEAITGLDIEGVLKDSDIKETETYSSEIEEGKLLDTDMDDSIKLIQDQEKNAVGSSLNEKEKALALQGGDIPLFDQIYGAQEADIKRNAWLMLAKFGARLMEKPVGVAAEESLTDFEKIAKEKRDLRTITTMKEAEWEHQKEMKLMEDFTKNPTKMAEYIEHLTAKFMRENEDWGIEKARIAATNHAMKYGSSQTKALLDQAQGLAKRLSTANGLLSVNQVYDRFGWKMLLDDNIGTENMVRLPFTTKKVKKTVDGKTKRVKEEQYDFGQLSGKIIRPGLFYFIDTGIDAGAIYQYTGEGAIKNWDDVLSADTEGTWKVYSK